MYVRQGKYEVAVKIFEKELDVLTGNVPREENFTKNVLPDKVKVMRSAAIPYDDLNVTQSSSMDISDVSDDLIHDENATRNIDNGNSSHIEERREAVINSEGESESKNKSQTNLTSKDEMKKTENGMFKATIKEVVKEEVKILSYESKMKVIALRTTLANIYSTHLSNVRRAGHHFHIDLILLNISQRIFLFLSSYLLLALKSYHSDDLLSERSRGE